jgi:hypothetical protein
MTPLALYLFVITPFLVALPTNAALGSKREPLSEEHRLAEYVKRNYTWPIPRESFVPQTEGWISLMTKRWSKLKIW